MIFGGQLPDFVAILVYKLALYVLCGLILTPVAKLGLNYFKSSFIRLILKLSLFFGLLLIIVPVLALLIIHTSNMSETRIARYDAEYEIRLGEPATESLKRRKETITYDYPYGLFGPVLDKEKRKTIVKHFDFSKNPREKALYWTPNGPSQADTRNISLKLVLDGTDASFEELDLANYHTNPRSVSDVIQKFPELKASRIEHLLLLYLRYPNTRENKLQIDEALTGFRKLGFKINTPISSDVENGLPIEGSHDHWSLLIEEDKEGRVEVTVDKRYVPKSEEKTQ